MKSKGKMLPIFLVGSPRSGTTLLSAILEVKFNIAVPMETHFVPYYSRLLWLWGDLSIRKNREKLVEELFVFLDIWTARNNPARSIDDYWGVSLLSLMEQKEEIVSAGETFGAMAGKMFDLFAQNRGCENWADNSSFYDVEPIENWDKHFPNIHVIHLVRDGRDATISWLKSWFAPTNFSDTTMRWVEHVTEKKSWGDNNPDRYLEIYYEDLIDDPLTIIAKIGSFINAVPNDSPINLQNSPYGRVLGVGGTHDLLKEGDIKSSNKEKWLKEMPIGDQQFFEYMAGVALNQFSYPLKFKGFNVFLRCFYSIKRFVFWFKRLFIKNFYLRKAKSALPVIIFVAIRLGFSPKLIIKLLR
ncbi:MAG: sulfotransferase [Magnetococcales bacterium]|nr:sulfotransferase [Magnetococcales bacterium]